MDDYGLNSSQDDRRIDDEDILEYVSALASSNYRSTLESLADNLESCNGREEEQSFNRSGVDDDNEKDQYLLEDMEQLKHALTEKDKDLQLAARIGKCLLERNQQLQNVNDHLENQISVVNEELVQLKHELQQKMEILKRWTQENQCAVDSSPSSPCSSSSTPSSDKKINTLNSLERKLTALEEENAGLKLEVNHLKHLAECLHDKEQQLTRDFAKQTALLNAQLKELTQKFARNQDQLANKDDQLDQTKKELIEKALLNKKLTAENEELTLCLLAAQETQRELAQELSDLRDRYGEISAMLRESRMQLKRSSDDCFSRRGSTLGFYSPGFGVDSLASELEDATLNQSDQGYDSFLSCNSPRRRINPRSFKSKEKILELTLSDNQERGEATTSTQYANLCKLDDNTLNNLQDTELIVVTEHLILKNSPEMGVPGVPGSKDLDNALKRLSFRKKAESDYQNFKTERRRSSEITVISRQTTKTTCSSLPHFAGHNRKLLLLKPMQGSETLAHWRQLAATPTFDEARLEKSTNGVRVKAEFPIVPAFHSRYYSGGVDSGINSDVESSSCHYVFRQEENLGSLTLTFVTSQMVMDTKGVYTEAHSGVGGQVVTLTTGVYTKLSSNTTIMHQAVKNPISSTGILELVECKKSNTTPLGLLDLTNESSNVVVHKQGVLSRANINAN